MRSGHLQEEDSKVSRRPQVQDHILTFRTIGLRSWESTEPLSFSYPLFSYSRLTFTTPPALKLPTALRFICCLRILHPFLRGECLSRSAGKRCPSHLVKHDGGGGGSVCVAVALPRERRVSVSWTTPKMCLNAHLLPMSHRVAICPHIEERALG